MKKNFFRVFLLLVFTILTLVGVVRSFGAYTPGNVVFYLLLTAIGMWYFFGIDNVALLVLFLIPVLAWHVCGFYVLGWLLGLVQAILFWYLLSKRLGGSRSPLALERRTRETVGDLEPFTLYGDRENGILYFIPSMIPPCFNLPSSIKKRDIRKQGSAYLFVRTTFGVFDSPTDLSRCANPDICGGFSQIFGFVRMEMYHEDSGSYEHFYVPKKEALKLQSTLIALITKACKENDLKRVVAPARIAGVGKHGDGKKNK